MYDRFINVTSLVDETLFAFLYQEAAIETASLEKYRYDLDPEALELAGSKFVSDILQLDSDHMEKLSWERQVSIVINLLVRATASCPIIHYLGPALVEGTRSGLPTISMALNVRWVRDKTNSLVAFVFACKVLSLELSNFFHDQGWYSANVDALRDVRTREKARYVGIIHQDAQTNFTASRKMRRDFRVTWAIKALLKRHLVNRRP